MGKNQLFHVFMVYVISMLMVEPYPTPKPNPTANSNPKPNYVDKL